MSTDPIGAVKRHLLIRRLTAWGPAALRRSRRATFAQAYDGPDDGAADDSLRAIAGFAADARGRRLSVVVLAAAPGDLAARLGAAEAGLSADVGVHLIPGMLDRLPVALRAAGAAGAPVMAFLDAARGPAPDPAVLAAVAAGRPAEVLLVLGPAAAGWDARSAVAVAGLPLMTQVELVVGESRSQTIVFGTSSDKSLEGFKNALWSAAGPTGVLLRDRAGRMLAADADPDLAPLCRAMLTEVSRMGSGTVTELRRFALTATPYRAADALTVLADLLVTGAVCREPEDGRLGGDVIIRPAASSTA